MKQYGRQQHCDIYPVTQEEPIRQQVKETSNYNGACHHFNDPFLQEDKLQFIYTLLSVAGYLEVGVRLPGLGDGLVVEDAEHGHDDDGAQHQPDADVRTQRLAIALLSVTRSKICVIKYLLTFIFLLTKNIRKTKKQAIMMNINDDIDIIICC